MKFLFFINFINSTKQIPEVQIISWYPSMYKLITLSSDRASPSTRDAIAGILSFSAQCYSTTAETNQQQPQSAKSSKLKTIIEENDDEDEDDLLIENMDKVHQDDDFSKLIKYLFLSYFNIDSY